MREGRTGYTVLHCGHSLIQDSNTYTITVITLDSTFITFESDSVIE